MVKVRLIGLWRGPHAPGWPDVSEYVDSSADEVGRERIAQILDGGRRTDRAYMGYSQCRLCGSSNGSGELTNGVFVWPEGLSHYIREHRVRLPDLIEESLLRSIATDVDVDYARTATNDDRDVEWWRTVTAKGTERPKA